MGRENRPPGQRMVRGSWRAATAAAMTAGSSSAAGAGASSEIDPHESVALLERRGVGPVLSREPRRGLLGGVGARAAHLPPLGLAPLGKARTP